MVERKPAFSPRGDADGLGGGALRSLLDAASQGFLVIGADGAVRYANRAAGELLGKAPADLVGRDPGIPVEAGGTREIEVDAHGRRRTCEVQVASAAVAGQPLYLASVRDVSDRRRREVELERARREAEAASRAKTALINMIAHEFRTPLSVIAGYTAMMEQEQLGPVPAGWKQPLEKVREKTAELEAMVEDMLTAARIEAGRVTPEPELVDLRDVARAAVKRAAGRGALLNAQLRIALPGEPVPARVDAAQIGVIIDNLINNALNYTEGEPWVEVRVSVAGGGSGEIRVTDRGVGIPRELQPRVFERFERLSKGLEGRRPGTGLGLSIARDLAAMNGAQLELESSDPGQGSCFLLRVPLARR